MRLAAPTTPRLEKCTIIMSIAVSLAIMQATSRASRNAQRLSKVQMRTHCPRSLLVKTLVGLSATKAKNSTHSMAILSPQPSTGSKSYKEMLIRLLLKQPAKPACPNSATKSSSSYRKQTNSSSLWPGSCSKTSSFLMTSTTARSWTTCGRTTKQTRIAILYLSPNSIKFTTCRPQTLVLTSTSARFKSISLKVVRAPPTISLITIA